MKQQKTTSGIKKEKMYLYAYMWIHTHKCCFTLRPEAVDPLELPGRFSDPINMLLTTQPPPQDILFLKDFGVVPHPTPTHTHF